MSVSSDPVQKQPRSAMIRVLFLLLLALGVLLWAADRWESRMPERAGEALAPGDVPSFVPSGGEFSSPVAVEIRPSHSRAHVVFTTDGTVPTATVGILYDRPLRLDPAFPGVVVLRARQFLDGVPGPVTTTSYVVGLPHTLPILSIVADPADLWDPAAGILANPGQRGAEWERPVHLTFFTGTPEPAFGIPAGLRVHHVGHNPETKPSFRLYFRQEYGPSRLEYPILPAHPEQDVRAYKRLLLLASDRAAHRTLLEDALLNQLAARMGLHAPYGRFVLLFLNGEPYGIYRLSERVDRFFAGDVLGLTAPDVIRNGRADDGDPAHWEDLLAWVRAHDLKDPANYAALQEQVDLEGFTDLVILLAYFGQTDFLAVRPGDGSEPWLWLPAEGYSWGLLRADVPPGPLASPEAAGALSELLFRLLENPDYRARFASRLADRLNTVLSPAAVLPEIDGLAATLAPDTGYEQARWPSPARWESGVEALQDFARRRPDLLREQAAWRLGLGDVVTLTLNVSPEGAGTVFVNGEEVGGSWSGAYFADTTVWVTAVPEPGYTFAGWESDPDLSLPASPQIAVCSEARSEAECRETACSQARSEAECRATVCSQAQSAAECRLTARFVPVSGCPRAVCPDDVVINEFWINDDGTRYLTLGNRPLEGDWIELRVVRGPADLRGWRLTDNDTKTGTDEGSIIFSDLPAFAAVPEGTLILIIATETPSNDQYFGRDDLDPRDGRMVLYVGNGNLDVTTDPGFGLGLRDDNLALLVPGPTAAFEDDIGVDFVAEGHRVTPFSFGILADGVKFGPPFRGLGNDDGAFLRGLGSNDGADVWVVDPPAEQTGDTVRMDVVNLLTPGGPNPGQWRLLWPLRWLWAP